MGIREEKNRESYGNLRQKLRMICRRKKMEQDKNFSKQGNQNCFIRRKQFILEGNEGNLLNGPEEVTKP